LPGSRSVGRVAERGGRVARATVAEDLRENIDFLVVPSKTGLFAAIPRLCAPVRRANSLSLTRWTLAARETSRRSIGGTLMVNVILMYDRLRQAGRNAGSGTDEVGVPPHHFGKRHLRPVPGAIAQKLLFDQPVHSRKSNRRRSNRTGNEEASPQGMSKPQESSGIGRRNMVAENAAPAKLMVNRGMLLLRYCVPNFAHYALASLFEASFLILRSSQEGPRNIRGCSASDAPSAVIAFFQDEKFVRF
jgi:hypothetical protein